MTNENINFAELRDSLHDRAIIDHLGVFDLRTLPILPDAWPTNGKVRIYGYRMQSLPTGTVQYRVWSSSHCVTIDLKMRETSLHSLGSDSILGDIADIDDTRVSTRRKLEDGEAALLAVCTGADPEEMRPRLATYLEWLDVVPVLGEEMKGHAPEFFRWLEDSARGTESR